MRVTTMPPVAAATAGAVCISSSAVLMKLASTASPGVVVAVTGRSPDTDPAPEAGYSRRRTRIIRHASAASTDTSPSKSP